MTYPRNLYKSPGKIKWNSKKTYDTVLVNSDEEYSKAVDNGFIDSFQEALFPPVDKELTVDEKEALVVRANEMGLGAKSTLRRLSIETLEKKILEA